MTRSRPAPSGSARAQIVYVHGLGESSLSFESMMRDRRFDDVTHLAPDLPGYGRSPWTETPLTLKEHGERLRLWLEDVVLDNERLDRVVLVGHSMGGVIGQQLAARLEQAGEHRLTALINVEGNISRDDCTASMTASRCELGDFLAHGFDSLIDELYEAGRTDSSFRGYYASARFCDPRAFHLNSRELVELSLSETLAHQMGALAIPSVYLCGEPGGTGKHSQQLLSEAGVEIRSVSPAGHWPFLDQHEAFAAHVREHLDSWLDSA